MEIHRHDVCPNEGHSFAGDARRRWRQKMSRRVMTLERLPIEEPWAN